MKFFLLLCFLSMACISSLRAQKDSILITIQGDTIRREPGEELNIFSKAELEPFFPGGVAAWQRFLTKNLVYPDSLVDVDVQGVVMLQFIVLKDGRICNLQAISGAEELKGIALATMRKSPNWEPARFSGRAVDCYKKQPIIFRLEEPEETVQAFLITSIR